MTTTRDSRQALEGQQMDARSAITAAENAMRDLVSAVLSDKYGSQWFESCGLTEERRVKIAERRDEERHRRAPSVVDERLIYYADITDLHVVMSKHWEDFKPTIGERKDFDVFMRRLQEYRNPEMHGRALLPFEQNLALGMSGEIRNRVTLYLSNRTVTDQFFPRIERITDSFGNSRPNDSPNTGIVLRPGDEVRFKCSGWDPEGLPLEWQVVIRQADIRETLEGDTYCWKVEGTHIGTCDVVFFMSSARSYHLNQRYDDVAQFQYLVVPASR